MRARSNRHDEARLRSRSPVWNRLATAPVVVALAMALAPGCGADDPSSTGGPGAGSRLDPTVLEGTATTLDGTPFDLASLAGNDLVVWFWAPW